jgi:hypothetical protein
MMFLASIFIFSGAIGINLGIHILVYFVTNSLALSIFSGLFFFILLLGLFLYFAAWSQIASICLLINKETITFTEAFTQTKSKVWQFISFQCIVSIFILGLMPLSIVSFFLVYIAWFIWGIFSYIMFIENTSEGLKPLWRSYHTVNENFFNILGQLLIISLIFSIIILILNILATDILAFRIIQGVLTYLLTPFLTIYIAEIYRNVPKQKYAIPDKRWIYASLVGWAIMIIFITYIVVALLNNPVSLLENITNEDLEPFFEQFEQVF